MNKRNKLAEFYDAELANVTGRLFDALKEIERLRAIVRVNGLRWGHTHAEIDALLDQQRTEQ